MQNMDKKTFMVQKDCMDYSIKWLASLKISKPNGFFIQ